MSNPRRDLVTYDIADDCRRAALFDLCRQQGDHTQFAVFIAELIDRELASFKAKIDTLIHHQNDQVLIADLGPVHRDAGRIIASLGRPYQPPVKVSITGGCTIMDGNAIVTGTVRDPISPEKVKRYRAPPAGFEEVAIVDASAGHELRKSSSLMNAAIQRLKKEAAKVGANGVLLSELDGRDAPIVSTTHGSATASGGGTSLQCPESGAAQRTTSTGTSHSKRSTTTDLAG